MPVQDRAELRHERRQPPPALPDGSMPTYDRYPLPGTAGGGPPMSPFGWGPDPGSGRVAHTPRDTGPPAAGRLLLITALLFICSVTVAGLLTVIALQA
ncbi:hypothetical protein AB0E69_08585 [Kribbella sp. NPDC026611]|uniref:hypothetical protein n=1 Tax=Kribbella sp. NPDC026611 TaxID=3154911 RepID=UPI0033F8A971